MLVLVVDVALMPILFFVAGYLATPSLQRRGPRGFVREKLVRLGIPWVLGVVLAPLATYLTYVSRNVPMSYLQFWATDFWGSLFQQGVYWFLGVLLLEFLVLVYAYAFPARATLQAGPRVVQPKARLFAWFVVLTAGGSILFAPLLGLDDWQSLRVLVVQPARIAFYVGYFALGVCAERHAWFTEGGFRPRLALWGPGCLLAGAAYLAYRLADTPRAVPAMAVTALLFSAFCLTALLAGVALFSRWVNGAGLAWRTLAANSFGIYYVHPLILYALAWVRVGVSVPSWLKATGLVVVTLVLSLAVSALVLRRPPGLRRMFWGRVHLGGRQGADEGEGVFWFSRPLRSKIEALPDGSSMTVILSVSFWMYWYCRIWSESEAASVVLAFA